MERIIEAVVNRVGKALVTTCAAAALIAASVIVGTPNTGSAGNVHNFGDCSQYSSPDGWCAWMCAATGHDNPSEAYCCEGR